MVLLCFYWNIGRKIVACVHYSFLGLLMLDKVSFDKCHIISIATVDPCWIDFSLEGCSCHDEHVEFFETCLLAKGCLFKAALSNILDTAENQIVLNTWHFRTCLTVNLCGMYYFSCSQTCCHQRIASFEIAVDTLYIFHCLFCSQRVPPTLLLVCLCMCA